MIFDMIKNGPILFIGCHPDDIEIGCGGLLNRIKDNKKIFTLTLSKNQKNPNHKNLIKEHRKSLNSLGIKNDKIILGNFTTREFNKERQEICDFLLKIKNEIKPSTIFTVPFDLHQDHQIGNMETQRIFREQTILEYEIPRSTSYKKPEVFVKLSKKDINKKINALKKYKTYKNKNYFKAENIEASAISHGIKMNISMCEIFFPISIIF
jgi:N-acetylglucosamine malate deacetylase 1